MGVLDRLSLEEGYVLDYVYCDWGGGAAPVVYARAVGASPYSSCSAFLSQFPGASLYSPPRDYLIHVRTDGTEIGFFQWVVLAIMANQFHLFWHAMYDDYIPVCTSEAVARVLPIVGELGCGEVFAPIDADEARALDLQPRVTLGEEEVEVRLVVFTLWGGFIERTYKITRSSPHRILSTVSQTLLEYHCGFYW